jgi:hypothetical protein
MIEGFKKVAVYFYRTDSGNEPVRKWLKSLEAVDRKIIGDDLQTLEYDWPIGMPLIKHSQGPLGTAE